MKLARRDLDEQLSLVSVSRLSSNMTFLSSKRTHLIDWRIHPDTAKVTGVNARALCSKQEKSISRRVDKTDCKEASVIWDYVQVHTCREKDYSVRN
jgi:hypothetical protein